MKTCLMVSLYVGGPSSRAVYQTADLFVEEFDTTIVTCEHDNIHPDIREQANELKQFSNYKYLNCLLLPFYCLFIYWKCGGFDIVTSTQEGVTATPGLLLRPFYRYKWIVLANRSPAGFKNRSDNGKYIDISYFSQSLRFYLAVLSFRHSDSVISYDYSDIVKENAKRSHFIRGGTDCEKISELINENEISDGRGSQTIKLVYVGNMYFHRGIDILFEAISLCEEDVELTLIGPEPMKESYKYSGNFYREFYDYLESNEENIRYLGVMEHKEVLIELLQSDVGICILPYSRGMNHYRYSYPLKIFEYMATSNAIIATDTTALSSVLSTVQLVNNKANVISERIDHYSNNRDRLSYIKSENSDKSGQYCWSKNKKDILEHINSI